MVLYNVVLIIHCIRCNTWPGRNHFLIRMSDRRATLFWVILEVALHPNCQISLKLTSQFLLHLFLMQFLPVPLVLGQWPYVDGHVTKWGVLRCCFKGSSTRCFSDVFSSVISRWFSGVSWYTHKVDEIKYDTSWHSKRTNGI